VAEALRKRRVAWERKRETAVQRGYDTRWSKVRSVKMSQNPICEMCNVKPAEMVHHKAPVSEMPDLRLVLDNLMSVCRRCHEMIHKGERFGRSNGEGGSNL